jgi:SHS2 domain-containing protein
MNKRHTDFAHDSDSGVVGHGDTSEAAMEAGAEATFSNMWDLQNIQPQMAVRFSCEEDDPELALVTWLNRRLTEARAAGLLLGQFTLRR